MMQDIAIGSRWVARKDHPKNRGKVFTVISVSAQYIGYKSDTAKTSTYCSQPYFESRYLPYKGE